VEDEEAVEVAEVVVVEDTKAVTEVMIMMKTAMAATEVASEEATEDGVASEDEEGAVVAFALVAVITAVRVATSPEIARITIMSN